MFNIFKKKRDESITDKYLRLMDEGKLPEALEAIEEIITQNPNISTSYFNYGICLSQLGRHDDSANAFLKAYKLDNTDGAALYRACISLAVSNNKLKLYEVFKSELEWNPYMINDFIDEEMFYKFFTESKFVKLKEQYLDYIGKEEH